MITNPQNELRQHLNHSEALLWTGRPKRGVIFRISDIFMIPFSIFWCGFAIFWVIGASEAGGVFGLFGVPFVIIGLFMVFGRFIIDAAQRAGTVYGITEERIIIKSGIRNKSIQSLNIKTLTDVEITEKQDGTGTITIGPKSPYNAWGSSMNWWPGMPVTPMLELIPQARKVYNQIIELQQER